MLSTAAIAKIAHEANRAYCESLGDFSQDRWSDVLQWQRDSAMNGVLAIERGAVTKPEHSHENWLSEKDKDGWVYGPKKNADLSVGCLTHPCMVPFNTLTAELTNVHTFIEVKGHVCFITIPAHIE